MHQCPRCSHPAATVPTTCSQCGCPVPETSTPSAPTSAAKLWLGVVAVLLAGGLIALAIYYLKSVNQLVR